MKPLDVLEAVPPTVILALRVRDDVEIFVIDDRVSVGGMGTMFGVTEFEGSLAELVPLAFVAVTVKVYGVPLVRPVTV